MPLTEVVPVTGSAAHTNALLVSQGNSPDYVSLSTSHEVFKSDKIFSNGEQMSQNSVVWVL